MTMTILLGTDGTSRIRQSCEEAASSSSRADTAFRVALFWNRMIGGVSNELMTELTLAVRWKAVSRLLESVLRCRHRTQAAVRPV